jgi:hypothetical protein
MALVAGRGLLEVGAERIDWPICSISTCFSLARTAPSRPPPAARARPRCAARPPRRAGGAYRSRCPSPCARAGPLLQPDLRHVHITQSIRASFRRGGLLDRVHRSCTCKGWNPRGRSDMFVRGSFFRSFCLARTTRCALILSTNDAQTSRSLRSPKIPVSLLTRKPKE